MRRKPQPRVQKTREVTRKRTKRRSALENILESDFVLYSLVSIVGVITYANSVEGEFVHDDIPAIVSNNDVNGGNSVFSVFLNDFWGTPMSDVNSHKSYRPLTTLTFRLNYILSGVSNRWWHITNVLLHATCTSLVLRSGVVLARLDRPFAVLAALLFAVHPVHAEAVAGVVGRADVLACLFFLCSLLIYHEHAAHHRVWPSITLAALSMLAKETGLTALLFNFAFDVYRNWKTVARSPRSKPTNHSRWSLLCALLVLATVRVALLQGSLPAFSVQDNPPAFQSSCTARIMTFCYLAAFNWWLLLCPWTLSHDWQMGSIPLVNSVSDPRNLLTCIAVIGLLMLAYRCYLDLEAHKHTPAVAGLMLLVIPYLPASNLLVTVGFVVAERILYIPSVGSVLLTAYGVQLLYRRTRSSRVCRKLLIISVGILIAAGLARTYVRNQDWKNRESLLRSDLAVLPHNAKLHYNFANFLKDTEQPEEAIKHYKEALSLWPSYASAHNNLGTLVVETGNAEHHFLQALKYNRDHVNAHYNLAKLYRKKNLNSEALKKLERCISLEPRFVQAYLELLLLTPQQDQRWILDKLLQLEPRNWEHYLLYGNWFKDRGLLPLALHYYTQAMRVSFSKRTSGHGPSVRAACLALRTKGQWSRILQVLSRWHIFRGDGPALVYRLQAERAWRLHSELAGRAAMYAQPQPRVQTSTCLHYSQLEIPSNAQKNNMKTPPPNDITDKTKCQKYKDHKKSVSIPLYKPTHNKSESGHKQKSCPLHKKKKIKEPEKFQSFGSELIKTF